MGGLVSIMVALRLGSDNVKGLILSSPALGIDMNLLLTVQKFFAPVINAFAPKARVVDAVRPDELSRNPQVVRAYNDDPLIQKGKTVARTAIEISKTFDVVKERRHEITCPMLILQGTDDRVTSTNASLDFFCNVGSLRKRYLRLGGLYHEILEEPQTPLFLSSIVEFASSGGTKFAVCLNGKETEEEGLIDVEFPNQKIE